MPFPVEYTSYIPHPYILLNRQNLWYKTSVFITTSWIIRQYRGSDQHSTVGTLSIIDLHRRTIAAVSKWHKILHTSMILQHIQPAATFPDECLSARTWCHCIFWSIIYLTARFLFNHVTLCYGLFRGSQTYTLDRYKFHSFMWMLKSCLRIYH